MAMIVEQAPRQGKSTDKVENVIEAREIYKSFGAFQVVKGVSLEVKAGEVFGLLGPNGAGKTTLISVLTGILTPDKGSATMCGFDLVKDARKVKDVISLVPQDLTIYQELSALENLKFFARMYHLAGKLAKERIDEVLEIARLTDVAKKKAGTYSGGMKRRLNLAIGLLNHPRLLFLDEPTVGVDPQSRNHIFECIRMLVRERNMSVFYTTHYMEEAQTLCHRVAIYDHGQIIALGTPQELIQKIGATRLTFSIEALPEDVLEQVRELATVQQADYSEQILTVAAPAPYQAARDVIGVLQQRDVPVTDMQTQEVNLETVFLSLTGKALRE
ncbi:ABC-2 type transport system ATP-binding protein [Thermosporothrix hazakensis]|uniref:ABC-2 type transport system ATP-binding protein n=2 Tax=Thermosporothrix TaxID=768650 RepID=A0A326U2G4_THEHA|nr:ABC transporter ATP-binding protein [Thermosporothrix hazakensis]PZW22838.1 ABC-2 type transport system ATP-binding protein [Thermosporothrix hazakensis]BBH91663.1 ABC transporter ATP-binding protein [Thermosporothrix sp. COM3]GCE49805.1 ABC transporter ATP-binding protein [Thermosporothrix hazakensis]